MPADLSSTVDAEQRGTDSLARPGRLQVAPGQRDRTGGAMGTGNRLPARGHGRALRERGRRRARAQGQRRAAREGVHHHEGLEHRPGIRADAERIRSSAAGKLGIDVVDLYLVHWPVKGKYKDTWKALEKLLAEGKVRAIGVSNFLVHHLEDLLAVLVGPSGPQPGGVPSLPRAEGPSGLRRAVGNPARGLVSPDEGPQPRSPRDHGHREEARQDERTGSAPLGSAARSRDDPEVRPPREDPGKQQGVRFLRSMRTTWRASPPSMPARASDRIPTPSRSEMPDR